jgi:glyoxylase-like metal-dependent hydrolase (beta-lactamase superfamily II)
MPITRLIVTHHHMDHFGNCQWICDRWGIGPEMTEGEHDRVQFFLRKTWLEEAPWRSGLWKKHGLGEAATAEIDQAWRFHHGHFSAFPEKWRRIKAGDVFRSGGFDWHVMAARGHAPEQALLYSPGRGLLISGDQILPKITPNVSVFDERFGTEPLSQFLNSNQQIAQTCGDVMVLPSHGLPFMGLHSRIAALEEHHEQRLAAIEGELKNRPQTAAALIPSLFGDGLTGFEIGFAIGEIIAHLNYLVAQGRAHRVEKNGIVLFGCGSAALYE